MMQFLFYLGLKVVHCRSALEQQYPDHCEHVYTV